jgi:branched-chain amino acid transport system ATP-binding protein
LLLEVRNLSINYGSIKAIQNVSFSVQEGHIIAIIGSNGAGKSSILKTISGIKKPVSGSIFFKGENITNLEPHIIVKKGISHVPEGRGIFAPLTVLENLEIAASSKRNIHNFNKALNHVFELFPRLKERKNQPAGTLSGGEQQMLAFGRALISGGELLLLDEPSMGLSPALVSDIFQTIKKINSEGTTILLVEQNAHKALSIANYAYVLEIGSIILEGNAKEIRNNPKVIEAYLGS